jgi:ornithine decarboxylase
MEQVLRTGCSPDRIIYAQPCKTVQDIQFADEARIPLTVVDSVEEVEKLVEAKWKGSVLIRMLVEDKGSKQPFGKKFGAPLSWVADISRAAERGGIVMEGFSFHVGSECMTPVQYYHAIETCAEAAKITSAHGYKTKKIDIGGGFLQHEWLLSEIAGQLCKGRKDFFPDVEDWISEPGRFFAAPTHTLKVPIIGKKRALPSQESDAAVWRYTLDESVYGMFSNIPFDHQKPEFQTAPSSLVPVRSILFGRTCDSADMISDNAMLPEMEIGDILTVPNMGAYTAVTASEFNGFPKSKHIYLV